MPHLPTRLRRGSSSSPTRRPADYPAFADRSDRRRRPFATWVKKLTGFKGASGDHGSSSKKGHTKSVAKKRPSKYNNPYPQSGRIGICEPAAHRSESRQTFSTAHSAVTSSGTSIGAHSGSADASVDGHPPPTAGTRSMAPTVSTDHEAAHSIAAPSHGASSLAGTSRTANGMDSRRGGDSTFSSPAPSVQSLTTTLTTIQSLAPNGGNPTAANSNTSAHHASHQSNNSQVIHFDQPFPTQSPASAIPAHLNPSGSSTHPGHPTTYTTATANGLLTDNASILTLASSSKRRRRRSFDTDASVRALAPSSLFGGSRESLPLSVLSANVEAGTPGLHQTRSVAERTSIYSATGILASERNSYYAKQSINAGGGGGTGATGGAGDGASVRSGLLGHGRADSVTGSIGGMTSPLASPREVSELDKGKDGVNEKDEDGVPEKE
ncbi:ca2+-modulated nonselective cation channel polycystin protein [Pleurostoma richardsiae]|uniref:Ca2+-modulated nonselective cation channel polycystin protein n=1 Tax=Pleurostoma richardsiae TaxID=41990 RepID=A0AA38RDK6_9PEZI|nr:ca2+-modulated nonselective cation channel polycystin protein [Pleurostoma richardsiae]